MPLGPGARLDGYELIELLGAGGMGEVWLATETRLGRKVALKLLPPTLTRDPARVARFEQEARAASALSHPNVCTIHALGESADGQRYIAMEHVEGRTLRLRLAERPLAVRDALDIGVQVAAALSAAHAAGIVHRDIKPENVMLRPDGFVKVLDFGLAKLVASREVVEQHATKTAFRTTDGVVVGTIAYMSPEQARGDTVDARTDVWALGCVLYEMVAGRSPFAARSSSDTLAAILEHDPIPLTRFDPQVPTELQRIVGKALRKDPDERYQVMKDLLLDLRALRDEWASKGMGRAGVRDTGAAPPAAERWRPSRALVVALAAGALLLVTGAVGWLLKPAEHVPPASDPSSPIRPLTSYSQRRVTFGTGLQTDPALSSDGRFLAYASDREGNFDIWVQPVAGDSDPVRVTRSEAQDTQPAWSADGTRLVFRSERDGGGLFVVPAFGGAEQRITSFGHRPRWSPDGSKILFVVGGQDLSRETGAAAALYEVPATGGPPREILADFLRGGGWRWIGSHPDGRLSALGEHRTRGFGMFTVSPDGQRVATSQLIPLGEPAAWPARFYWADGGGTLFIEAIENAVRSVWRVRVDPETLAWQSAERLTTAAGSDVNVTTTPDGRRTAFSRQEETTRIWSFPLDAAAARLTGAGRPITEDGAIAEHPALAPNGRLLAYVLRRPGTDRTELRALDLEKGTSELVAINARGGVWSPDSRGLAYNYVRFDRQPLELVVASRQLGGTERLLSGWSATGIFMPTDWSPDGSSLLGSFRDQYTSPPAIALWPAASLGAAAAQRIVLESPNAGLWQARYSPDARWIACVAERLDQVNHVQLVVAPSAGAPPAAWVRVAAEHEWPDKSRWAPDGKALFFISRRPAAYFNIWAVRFDPLRGRPVGEPFALTTFDSPGRRISTYIDSNELSISTRHAVIPVTTVTGSIWLLEHTEK